MDTDMIMHMLASLATIIGWCALMGIMVADSIEDVRWLREYERKREIERALFLAWCEQYKRGK